MFETVNLTVKSTIPTLSMYSSDVILDEDGNAVELTTCTEELPLEVKLCCLIQRARVKLDDRS